MSETRAVDAEHATIVTARTTNGPEGGGEGVNYINIFKIFYENICTPGLRDKVEIIMLHIFITPSVMT